MAAFPAAIHTNTVRAEAEQVHIRNPAGFMERQLAHEQGRCR